MATSNFTPVTFCDICSNAFYFDVKVAITDCRFNINIYKDSCQETQHRAVILSIVKDDKRMVACCSGNNEISAVEMELPHTIPETSHKALFYLKKLPAHNKFMFESSVYPSKFLGFEPDEDNPTLNKLVLRHKTSDEVDETAELTLMK
ncbi:interleukin-18-like isoform X2 [Toxotes jaculatrix]|uniref:interleukin-18-like isoform X2 n=1 Tax=Toxotes jaculatrix TaxID=941984 RepID=UPI001B3AE329|nr:interleukin-18-like isoform X2 [Toxotes jaculatrix]